MGIAPMSSDDFRKYSTSVVCLNALNGKSTQKRFNVPSVQKHPFLQRAKEMRFPENMTPEHALSGVERPMALT